MSLSPGTEVGAYEVDALLGSGGMASVYKVTHRVLGSAHALKVLHPQLVGDDVLRGRFLEEGRVQAQLRHPGLVRVTDLVSEPGIAGLIMDFLEGETVGERIRRGPLSVEEAVGYLLQTLGAVQFAHERGIVHRDLKPGNLFLVPEGRRTRVKVLDFGIAKIADKQRTAASSTIGTVAYMSPEQIQDPGSVDRRTDIFALGAVLYEMVTGSTAFDATTEFATMQRVVETEYTPLSAAVTNAPPALSRAIDRALRSDPGERHDSCVAFAGVLLPLADPPDRKEAEEWLSHGQSDAVESLSDPGVDAREALPEMPKPPATVTWEDPDDDSPLTFAMDDTEEEVRALVEEPSEERDLPILAREASSPISRARLEGDRVDTATRIAGGIQIWSGALNLFFMWMVSCTGMSSVSVGLANLLGVPGYISWIGNLVGLMGCLLSVVGLLELASGFVALIWGERGYRIARFTAFVELASLAMGGLFSALAGVVNLVLLLLAGPPETEHG